MTETDMAIDEIEADNVSGKMLENATITTQFLKSLAHPARLVILCRLAEGGINVGELESRLDLPQAAVSKQLARLREAAVQGRRPDLIGPLPPPRADDARPSSWVRGTLGAAFVLCLLALGSSFVGPSWFTRDAGPGEVSIRALPADYREPLALQVILGCSVREIAAALALSENAVMTRLFRARKKLIRQMENDRSAAVERAQ